VLPLQTRRRLFLRKLKVNWRVDFSYRIQDGDKISVYLVFESIDIPSLVRLRPVPLREVRFIADVHLGRLAAYLRIVGFDTLYQDYYQDEELARISSGERRTLLTRDRGLLKRYVITRGYCVPQRPFLFPCHCRCRRVRFALFRFFSPRIQKNEVRTPW
jgi:hypothetical protein